MFLLFSCLIFMLFLLSVTVNAVGCPYVFPFKGSTEIILCMMLNCIRIEWNYKYRIGCVATGLVLVKALYRLSDCWWRWVKLNNVFTCRSIDTKKAYHPPSDVRERIEKIAKITLSDSLASVWESTSLSDPKRKFKASCAFGIFQIGVDLIICCCHDLICWELLFLADMPLSLLWI